jgi:long-chain acyl-CoA synthetase
MNKLLTIFSILLKRLAQSPDAYGYGSINQDGQIESSTFFNYYKNIEFLSLGINSLGLSPKSPVALLGQTTANWHFIDMSCLCSRHPVIPIYHTYQKEEICFLLNHSEAKVLFIDSNLLLKKIIAELSHLPSLEHLILIEDLTPEFVSQIPKNISVHIFLDLKTLGKKIAEEEPSKFKSMQSISSPDDIATIIYTSGTTGEPKGAVITQKALCSMLDNLKLELGDTFSPKDISLIWLPLSHVFGRCDSFLPLIFGWQMIFARSLDTLLEDIKISRPTVVMAVPRIFEKIYASIIRKIDNGNIVSKKIFDWAVAVSEQYFRSIDADQSPLPSVIIQKKLAHKLVFSKIYEMFGGRIRFFVSGGAPLSTDVIKLLRFCGLTILEGYGLTETIAPCSLNPVYKQVLGTVGRPIGNTRIKIAHDGEILVQGEALFSEYYKNPAATKEVLIDGWFHTGDIGTILKDGFLKITDRKKDLIITSGGKNVAPQKIENMAKKFPHIHQLVVIGDQKKYLTALVTFDKKQFTEHLDEIGLSLNSTMNEFCENPHVIKKVATEIAELNNSLAAYESIKKFKLIPTEFSVENGLLTPSLKIRRKKVLEQYKDLINAMYLD